VVGRHPNDPAKCVLASTKSNLCVKPKSLIYTFEPLEDVARVGWVGPCDLTADEIIEHRKPGKETKVERCAAAIKDLLAGGPMERQVLDAKLELLGYSEHTIRDGKVKARVKPDRDGFGKGARYTYSLVPEAEEDSDDPFPEADDDPIPD
jgi:hypothetical protein